MPDWTAPLAARLASLRLAPAREREIVDELSQHLDDIYQELRAGGLTHDAAVERALEDLDEQDLLARELAPLRQASVHPLPPPGAPPSRNWIADGVQDVAYAARALVHAPLWTTVIVLLLALGIGANAALFSATDALLFSPLPVHDPGGLVRLRWSGQNDVVNEHDEYGFNRPGADGKPLRSAFSYDLVRQLTQDGQSVVDLFTCAPFAQVNLNIDGRAELADAFGASGNYFAVLGVQPRLGRLFVADDDRASAPPVAVISARYWQSRFGGDPSVIGRVIKANSLPVTIVGVTPAGFTGVQQPLDQPPDISFPLALDEQLHASTGRTGPSPLTQPTAWWLEVMGRLRPGATVQQVQARLDGVFQAATRADLDAYLKSLTDEERADARNHGRSEVPRLVVDSGARGIYDVESTPVTAATVLSAVVAVILLIICANVANLMLSRAIARQREIAVRLSLGATRSRLVRQLLTEALLLALIGAALGVAVAYWGIRLLPPPVSAVSVFQGRVFAFTLAAAVVTSLLFGAMPALRATSVDITKSLKDTGRGVSGRRTVLARGLLVLQVALSLVLLVAAGLFLQTLRHLRSVDVGFDPSNLVLVRMNPTVSGYDMPRTVDLYARLLERFGAIPGVRGATLSQPALLSGSLSTTSIYVEGKPAPRDVRRGDEPAINRLVVSPGFFKVMGLRLLRGRDLTDRDVKSSGLVAVINEAAARKYFPGVDPLGKRFGSQPDHASQIEIVGLVSDAKYTNLRDDPPPTMYASYRQMPRALSTFELRTAGSPAGFAAAVREAVRQIDPNLPITSLSTQVDQIERRFAQERLFAQAYSAFGLVALLLASVGLFGLMSYNVARRTPEMGIRMALGAQRTAVVRMVMRESLVLVTIGVAAGVALTFAAGRLVASLLFGLAPHDVATIATAIAVMAAVSALAAYLPARRASRVDPMIALRYE